MFQRAVLISVVFCSALSLMSFRMPETSKVADKLLYDVRGAFVTARPNVSQSLVIATDMLVDEAIRSTVRSKMLPRTIISVRIESTSRKNVLFGNRHEAEVSVKAIAVSNGEAIAQGKFTTSVFLMDGKDVERELAQRIADRIASEFRLEGPRRASIASALFP